MKTFDYASVEIDHEVVYNLCKIALNKVEQRINNEREQLIIEIQKERSRKHLKWPWNPFNKTTDYEKIKQELMIDRDWFNSWNGIEEKWKHFRTNTRVLMRTAAAVKELLKQGASVSPMIKVSTVLVSSMIFEDFWKKYDEIH